MEGVGRCLEDRQRLRYSISCANAKPSTTLITLISPFHPHSSSQAAPSRPVSSVFNPPSREHEMLVYKLWETRQQRQQNSWILLALFKVSVVFVNLDRYAVNCTSANSCMRREASQKTVTV